MIDDELFEVKVDTCQKKDASYKIDDIKRLIDRKMKIITFCGKFLSLLNKIKKKVYLMTFLRLTWVLKF